MKYLAHVPTESYGFISVEVEGDANEAVAAYKELQGAWKDGPGLSQGKFNQCLDTYIRTGKFEGGVECWEEMSEFQKKVINEIKKSLKRK